MTLPLQNHFISGFNSTTCCRNRFWTWWPRWWSQFGGVRGGRACARLLFWMPSRATEIKSRVGKEGNVFPRCRITRALTPRTPVFIVAAIHLRLQCSRWLTSLIGSPIVTERSLTTRSCHFVIVCFLKVRCWVWLPPTPLSYLTACKSLLSFKMLCNMWPCKVTAIHNNWFWK